MSGRKICKSCGRNFGKSSYYDHLPCQNKPHSEFGNYVFCDHCNMRVAKKTFHEHRRLGQMASTSPQLDPPGSVKEPSVNGQPSTCLDSEDDMESMVEGFGNNESSSSDDQEEQEWPALYDDEDQVFFSDTDEPEAAVPCFNGYDNTSEVVDESGSDNDQSGEEGFEYGEEDHCEETSDSASPYGVSSESKVLVLFLFLWQTLYKVSDHGMLILLKFLRLFMTMIGNVAKVESLVKFAQSLPQTLYLAKSYIGLGQDEFERFVACPKCCTLYKAEECTVRKTNGRIVSKKCESIRFPNHPQRNRRKQCGAFLMKQMRSKSGSTFLYPKRLYCFKKLSDSLRALLRRPGFLEKCESWRKRECTGSSMGDVFEGRIWREFLDSDGEPYFSTPGNMGVMLNVDWFQPYKHTNHSCGVMYLVLMNLPREERFKPENVIIVGIIPGPKEPKGDINSFLKPLVDELIDFWDGVIFEDTCLPGGMLKLRVALLALCCDVPATRKCGGFAGHSAAKGCNKCFKTFPRTSFGAKPDFSGFDVETWERRTNELHRVHAESVRFARCQSEINSIVRNTGAKYSVLLQLPYYDAVRFVIIDPMHNLFLGLAKTTLKVWKESDLLTEKHFELLQKRVDAVVPPPEIGRIPSKIATGFSGFTADQWKNWVCYYSVFALKGILPEEHYDSWLNFVSACRLICCHSVTMEQCLEAETRILKFCQLFENLYGAEKCTPNMHLSCHLVDCIRDYGPVYSFWCFSFERYNGILGSYHKNNHNIGIQLMRRFLQDIELRAIDFSDEHKHFQSLLSATSNQTGTLGEMTNKEQKEVIVPLPPVKRIALHEDDTSNLTEMYKTLLPNCEIVCAQRLCDSFSRVQISGTTYRCSSNYGVSAKWYNGEYRPGRVCRFLTHDVVVQENLGKRRKLTFVLAEVEWFKAHPERHWFPDPLEVWCTDFESPSKFSFIPVLKFHSQCLTVQYKLKFNYGREKVVVTIPLIGRFVQGTNV